MNSSSWSRLLFAQRMKQTGGKEGVKNFFLLNGVEFFGLDEKIEGKALTGGHRPMKISKGVLFLKSQGAMLLPLVGKKWTGSDGHGERRNV